MAGLSLLADDLDLSVGLLASRKAVVVVAGVQTIHCHRIVRSGFDPPPPSSPAVSPICADLISRLMCLLKMASVTVPASYSGLLEVMAKPADLSFPDYWALMFPLPTATD